jgi:hypothetical protein
MNWLVIVAIAIVAVVALVYLIGYFMPVNHKATHVVRLSAPREAVWKAITDFEGSTTWRRGIKNILITDQKHWTEISDNGTIHFEATVFDPPKVFVSRITNDDLPFGGTWTYELVPAGNETRLTITEDGSVYNPVFRFMSKYIFGHEATLRNYGADLKKKFNNP